MPNDVLEVKARLNIVDIAGQYLQLRKVGNSWKALCPFHTEKTPSFHLNEERQSYKCFGCAEGGDVLSFVMKMENLTFPEALHLLADRAGVMLDHRKTPAEYREAQDHKSRLYRLNKLAARFFHKILIEHPAGQLARDYLVERGLNEETITTFDLGYAPKVIPGKRSAFERFAETKGFTTRELADAGHPERFRHRLVFPLSDTLGNPIGFTGRALDPEDQPKYLNTPETVLFKKSRVLYPLHLAKEQIKSTGRALLFEGQTDVLLAHQLGSREGVATSGTALTSEHLAILKRYVSEIIFVFDNDEAGREATRKALLMAYELELEPQVIQLPQAYKDLGELAVARPELWPEIAVQAVPGIEWQVVTALGATRAHKLSVAEKKRVARLVMPLLVRVQDPIERAHWIQSVAKRIEVNEVAIGDAMKRYLSKEKIAVLGSRPDMEEQTESVDLPSFSPREEALGLVIRLGLAVRELPAAVSPMLFAPDSPARRVADRVEICYSQGELSHETQFMNAITGDLTRAEKEWVENLVFEVEKKYPFETQADGLALFEEAGLRLKDQEYEERKGDVARQIAAAEAKGDRPAVQKLLKEFQTFLKTKEKN